MFNMGNKRYFEIRLMKTLLCVLSSLLFIITSAAEGTKQLRPAYNDNGHIVVMRTATEGSNFASYFTALPSPVNNRLYFRIGSVNERIYLGFGNYKIEGDPGGNNAGNIATHSEAILPPINRQLRFRITRPDGTAFIAETAVPATGQGYIGNESAAAYNRSVAGPAQLAGIGGYYAFEYAPPVVGDFYIEFVIFNTVTMAYESLKTSLQLFDLTIATAVGPNTITNADISADGTVNSSAASGSAGTAIGGRLWSRAWRLSTGRNYKDDTGAITGTDGTLGTTNNLFSAKMYPYAEDGNSSTNDAVVTELDFNNMDPFGFVVSCNRNGLANTVNFFAGKKSIYRPPLDPPGLAAPLYQIFLQNPDINQFPNGEVGCLEDVTIKQCALSGGSPTPYCINIQAQSVGDVNVLIDLFPSGNSMVAGGDGVYTAGTRDVLITGQILSNGTTCVAWNGLDGNGVAIPDKEFMSIRVEFRAGLTNLPITDIENHPNGFRVSLVRPTTSACKDAMGNPKVIALPKMYWDDSNVQVNFGGASPVAPNDAGYTFVGAAPGTAPATTFGVSNLVGCNPNLLAVGEGCHRWVRRGKNLATPVPAPPAVSDTTKEETMNTWWYVADENITVPHQNDNSLFDIGSTLGSGNCVVNDGGIIFMEALFSRVKFDPTAFIYSLVEVHPTYKFINQILVSDDYLPLGVPANKRRVRLGYVLDVGNDGISGIGAVPTVGFDFQVTTNECGSPLNSKGKFDCTTIPLPVHLISFQGRLIDNTISRLEWQTATERDNKGFSLERSADGYSYVEVAFVHGKGDTNTGHQYNYTDMLPRRGTYYYRLRQIDLDGKESYSKVVQVTTDDLEMDFMYTSYNQDDKTLQVVVRQRHNEDLQIKVYNMLGVELHCLRVASQGSRMVQTFMLPMAMATSGTYIVEVKDSKNVAKKKVAIY